MSTTNAVSTYEADLGKDRLDNEWGMTDISKEIRALSLIQDKNRKPVTIIGCDPKTQQLLKKIKKIAGFNEPVLLMGESGVGKENLARAIHLLSNRINEPYITVNCPQYQEGNLTVSELFGHKKGSFTGALGDRKGCFHSAAGGVIFLDEIADLHINAQVMLLRALSEEEYKPIGTDDVQKVKARVVAATNRQLSELVVTNEFRNDLYFRLCYFRINIPPLRERGDDWYLLQQAYLHNLHLAYGVYKKLSDASLKLLSNYNWPGNIRELQSIVTKAYAYCDGYIIEPDDFVLELDEQHPDISEENSMLYRSMVIDGQSFWEAAYKPFMDRDLNRSQLRSVLRKGLLNCDGSYRALLNQFNIAPAQYQKFMDFLRHHNLKP